MRAITQAVLEEVAEQFDRTLESSDAIATLMSQALRAKVQEEAGARVLELDMLADAGRDRELAAILQDHSGRTQALLAEVLRKGQAQRLVDPDLNPAAAAAVLIALVDGVKMMGVRHPHLDRAEAFATLHTLIRRFLAAAPSVSD